MRKTLILALMALGGIAQADTLVASSDTYVESGDNAGVNYGSDPNIWAGHFDNLGTIFTDRSLYTFDLTGYSAAGVAWAQLQVPYFPLPLTQTFNVYAVDAAWSEGTVTWNDQPGIGEFLGSFVPNGFSTVDLTQYVRDHAGTMISLEIRSANETNSESFFQKSRETDPLGGDDYRTKLAIEPVPEPASLAALAIGALTLARRRRPR